MKITNLAITRPINFLAERALKTNGYVLVSTAFFMGALFYAGIQIVIQDYLGLDGYLEYVETHWVTLSPLVGCSVSLIAFTIAAYVGAAAVVLFRYLTGEAE
jgi:hypothetical protein